MKRSGPLRRSRSIARGSGPKPKRRKPSEFARIYGSRARVAWVKTQPCIARYFGCVGAIQNAHIVTGGMGRKADADRIVPACEHHHAEMHCGVATFQLRYGVNLWDAAEATDAAWRAHVGAAA